MYVFSYVSFLRIGEITAHCVPGNDSAEGTIGDLEMEENCWSDGLEVLSGTGAGGMGWGS